MSLNRLNSRFKALPQTQRIISVFRCAMVLCENFVTQIDQIELIRFIGVQLNHLVSKVINKHQIHQF